MSKEIKLQVTAEIAVNVRPNSEHEFLMTTKEVAKGYGISEYTLRRHKMEHPLELQEKKHFFTAVQILNGDKSIPHNSTLWTKRGIIRLGFFIKSKQAIMFRDWAEDLIINVLESGENFLRPVPVIEQKKPRNHNRLTQDRMISILSDVAKIDDKELRLSLISKLGV